MLPKIPQRWSEAREGLVPVLRPVTAPGSLWRAARMAGGEPLRFPVCSGLHGLLAWDHPDVRVFLRLEHIRRWGIQPVEAWQAACGNLDPGAGLAPEGAGWSIRPADGLASSRLLLPGWLAGFRGRVAGEPVAAVPTGRRLQVIGSEDVAGLLALQGESLRLFCAEGEPVSPVLYACKTGKLAPFEPENWPEEAPGEPSRDGLERLRCGAAEAERFFQGHLYREVGERLAEEGERLLDFRLIRRRLRSDTEDRITLSFCVLPGDLEEDVLLPEVDLVLLPGDRAVPWEALGRCLGAGASGGVGWLEHVEMDPPCVRLKAGIPASVWRALAAQAGQAGQPVWIPGAW